MDFIEEKIRDIEASSGKASAAFADLDAEAMDFKPNPDSWSINECLDHLAVSGSRYYAVFDALAENRLPGNAWARIPLLPKMWGKMILDSVRPETARKTKTFPVFMPAKSHYGKNMTPDLVAANGALIAHMRKVQGKNLELDRIMVTSPTAKFVVYSLRACLDILAEHQKRHFNQAMRVKQALPQGNKVA